MFYLFLATDFLLSFLERRQTFVSVSFYLKDPIAVYSKTIIYLSFHLYDMLSMKPQGYFGEFGG